MQLLKINLHLLTNPYAASRVVKNTIFDHLECLGFRFCRKNAWIWNNLKSWQPCLICQFHPNSFSFFLFTGFTWYLNDIYRIEFHRTCGTSLLQLKNKKKKLQENLNSCFTIYSSPGIQWCEAANTSYIKSDGPGNNLEKISTGFKINILCSKLSCFPASCHL